MVDVKLIVAIVSVCVLVVVVIWLISTASLDAENCKNIDAAYPLNAQMQSFPTTGRGSESYLEGGPGKGKGLPP